MLSHSRAARHQISEDVRRTVASRPWVFLGCTIACSDQPLMLSQCLICACPATANGLGCRRSLESPSTSCTKDGTHCTDAASSSTIQRTNGLSTFCGFSFKGPLVAWQSGLWSDGRNGKTCFRCPCSDSCTSLRSPRPGRSEQETDGAKKTDDTSPHDIISQLRSANLCNGNHGCTFQGCS
jgi:hypothetical protein